MSNRIEFAPTFPPSMSPSMPYSSSDFIAAKRTKLFLPDQQTDYTFAGNDRLVFTLNSNNEMLVGQDSWVEFDLYVEAAGGSLNATQLLERCLDVGGAHCLFKRVQISLSNGTVIEDIQGYNKLYSIVRLNTMSENHVKYVESMSGDGMVGDRFEPSPYDSTVWRNVTFTTAAYDHTGGAAERLLTLTGGSALTELTAGDIIRISTDADSSVVEIASITDNNLIILNGRGTDLASINDIKVARSGSLQCPRVRAASGTDAGSAIKLKMKPFSNFIQNSKWVPLAFLKNLQITLELERPELALKFFRAPGSLTTFRYTIKNPRFAADLVTPSEAVLQEMLQVYNSEDGIYFPFISFQGSLRTMTASAAGTVTIPSSVRSAKGIILAQYPSACENASDADSLVTDSISTTVRNLLTQARVVIGSENYPYGRYIDTDDVFCGEAFAHLQKCLDVHGNVSKDTSIIPNDYYAVNSFLGLTNESKRFVLGVPFSRDMTSSGCGVDLITNDLQFEFVKSAAGVETTLRSWIIFDSALKISRSNTISYK